MNKKLIKGIVVGICFVIAGVVFSCTRTDSLTANADAVAESEEFVLETETQVQSQVEIQAEVGLQTEAHTDTVLQTETQVDVQSQSELQTDGDTEIVSPEVTQAESQTSGGDSISTGVEDGKININTATAEELKTLNGIGDKRAEKIIAYREANGPFKTTEDIMKISGIKTAVYSKIKDRIKV